MSEDQNNSHSAALQSECLWEGEEEDDKDSSDQDLCPVCQLPFPNIPQQNRTDSFPQSTWWEPEQLQSSGKAPRPTFTHCDRYEVHPCQQHLMLPLSSSSAAASQQVICPDCWPLVRPHLMQLNFFQFFKFNFLIYHFLYKLPRFWRW